MMNHYSRVIIAVALIVVIGVIVSLATYTVSPGKVALVLHDGKTASVIADPGLHWKVPLFQNIAELDTRTRSSAGEVQPESADDNGLSASYIVFWRIADPKRYYESTHGDTAVVDKKLNAALTPVLREAMSAGDARAFLSGSMTKVHDKMTASVQQVAGKLGIVTLEVYPGTPRVPKMVADKVTSTMAAAVQTQIAAAKMAGKKERKRIARNASKKSTAIIARAKANAATITGKSQARVATIYAPVAKKAPDFFDYFINLENEADALKNNTRVLVLSMDSPWFKTLEKTIGQPAGQAQEQE